MLHQGQRLVVLAVSALVACAPGCQKGKGAELQVTAEPTTPLLVPLEIHESIQRISEREFKVERHLSELVDLPMPEDRRKARGQIVLTLGGYTVKFSPARTQGRKGIDLYLNLDANIARAKEAEDKIFLALGADSRAFEPKRAYYLERSLMAMDVAAHELLVLLHEDTSLFNGEEDRYRKMRFAIDKASAAASANAHSGTPEATALADRRDRLQKAWTEALAFIDWTPPIAGSLLALLGFEDLDQVMSINGAETNCYGDVVDIISTLGNAATVEVDLIRDGRPQRNTYHVVEKLR